MSKKGIKREMSSSLWRKIAINNRTAEIPPLLRGDKNEHRCEHRQAFRRSASACYY